jgi:hypothetical protein
MTEHSVSARHDVVIRGMEEQNALSSYPSKRHSRSNCYYYYCYYCLDGDGAASKDIDVDDDENR